MTQTHDFEVRTIESSDHDSVRKVAEEMLCRELESRDDLRGEDDLVDIGLAYGPPDNRMFVAESEGRIVGMAGVRRISDEDCELTRLYVREGYRRQGVASEMAWKLLEFVKQRGYRRLLFQMRPELKDVVRNPERFGLRPDGENLPRQGEFLSIRF